MHGTIQHIAFYGKGGSGKSTVAANVAVALAEAGRGVVVIGCEPEGEIVAARYATGEISVTRSMVAAPSALGKDAASSLHEPQVVLYDMPGEAEAPEFQTLVAETLFERAYLVASADFMSLHAANDLLLQLHLGGRADRLSVGMVANGLNGSFEESLVKDFAQLIGVPLVGSVPRSLVVCQCELYGKTVLEGAPHSNIAYTFRKVARDLTDPERAKTVAQTHPREHAELKVWARGWGDLIRELEEGTVADGAGI